MKKSTSIVASSNTISVRANKSPKLHELEINGMLFLSPEKDHFYVPVTLLKGININEFPKKVGITPYVYVLGNQTMFPLIPIEIINQGNGKVLVKVESCKSASEFTDNIGVEAFQALKKGLLLSQKSYNPKIEFYYFDQEFVHLHYTIEMPSGPIDDIVNQAADFDWQMTEKIITEAPDTYGQLRTKFNLPNLKINKTNLGAGGKTASA